VRGLPGRVLPPDGYREHHRGEVFWGAGRISPNMSSQRPPNWTSRPPTLTSTHQPRAALSSLTTPIPPAYMNRPTGAARDCFFFLPPRSRQRRRPPLYRLLSNRSHLRLTAPQRRRRPSPRRAVNCRSATVLPFAERGGRPGPVAFPTARLPKSPLTRAPRRTRRSAATASPSGRGALRLCRWLRRL
jgi:hypothetical protein